MAITQLVGSTSMVRGAFFIVRSGTATKFITILSFWSITLLDSNTRLGTSMQMRRRYRLRTL